MTFDAMAAAVDWLDAYRAGDIESILEFYADDAVIECGCGAFTFSQWKFVLGRQCRQSW
ncbi:hypothetical protein [Bradyrhizobium sp. 200]|uniref:hypothetical protein n=1 Tax=Bradyrhizobium sp. 200 TaxID=2782665 RepID=UPI001FFE4F2F|nr:hypothetical protein [Bradyrhizobium sp. 200]